MSAHQCMIWMKYYFRRSYFSPVTNATETVPVGAKEVEIRITGAGGGGGTSSEFLGGGGGGGGGYIKIRFNVQSGQTFNYSVGTGGQGGFQTTRVNGAAGTSSNVTFNGIKYTALPGLGGIGGDPPGAGFGGSTGYDVGGASYVILQADGTDGGDGTFIDGGLPGSATLTPTEQISTNGVGGNGAVAGAPSGGAGGDGAAGLVLFIYT